MLERWRTGLPDAVRPSDLPRTAPAIPSPASLERETAATWLGHSTVLLQTGGVTLLTDPVWARRVSPVAFVGPSRWVPPMLSLDDLPPIDVVLQSHNHYDHFDRAATRVLARRNPAARWCVPLGMAAPVRRCGVSHVQEFDWWESRELPVGTTSGGVRVRVCAVPAKHFSGRSLTDRDRTLWCGWTVSVGDARLYFAGDSGQHPEFDIIAEREGPFDLTILPIGAYEPRWFMSRVHMNPDEAVSAWQTIAGVQATRHRRPAPPLLGVHWGTYRLADEPMDEPPRRTRELWRAAGLDESKLWTLAHGETRRAPWLATSSAQ